MGEVQSRLSIFRVMCCFISVNFFQAKFVLPNKCRRCGRHARTRPEHDSFGKIPAAQAPDHVTRVANQGHLTCGGERKGRKEGSRELSRPFLSSDQSWRRYGEAIRGAFCRGAGAFYERRREHGRERARRRRANPTVRASVGEARRQQQTVGQLHTRQTSLTPIYSSGEGLGNCFLLEDSFSGALHTG